MNQVNLSAKIHIHRALYGSQSKIKEYINKFKDNIESINRTYQDSISMDMPFGIADVTIPIRFCLEPLTGLKIEKMRTKEHILGFFNPIPPFLAEHDNPVLCIVYKDFTDPLYPLGVVHINYYSDQEEVSIELPAAP